MNYEELYADCLTEDEKIDVSAMRNDLKADILKKKVSLVIFYNHIEECRAELGQHEIVSKILYTLYDYDITPIQDKENFPIPDFKEFEPEKAAAARIIIRSMIRAAESNTEKYIRDTATKRYCGSKHRRKTP